MVTEYHYLLLSQHDLLQNEAIEEVLRERTNSYISQKKTTDFWILLSPKFFETAELKEKIKNTNFYKQKQNVVFSQDFNNNFYAIILSFNKEFINWLSLRLGYFEDLNDFTLIQKGNKNYVSNGIKGSLKREDIVLFENNPNFLHPELSLNKYKKLLKLIYSVAK